MRKFTTLLFTGALALTILAGCSPASKQNETEGVTTSEASSSVVENQTSDTILITHSKGETRVPYSPKKIAVFDMGILDTIDTLGIQTELALPVDSLPAYLEKYNTAANAGAIKEPNMEALFEFAPEVIFISGRQADYYEELNKIAPTVYVDLVTETYLEDFERNTIYIGEMFGKSKEAQEKLNAVNDLIKAGREKALASEQKALILLTNDGSMSAYGKGSRFGIIHDVLGIKTADGSIDISTHGQEASYEYIAQANPDILYVVDRTAVVGGSAKASSTLDNALVQETNAFKNGSIVYLDADIWYLAGGGISAVEKMISEAVNALS